VIIIGCVLFIIYAEIATSKIHHPAKSLFFALTFAITFILLIFYIVDRLIVKHVNPRILVFVESVFLILFGLYYFFPENTIDINVSTSKDYILVLYDSENHLLEDFTSKRLVGKTLKVNENIIHVDSTLHHKSNVVIKEPEEWNGFSESEGIIELQGKPIHYTLRAKPNHPRLTIDSLWDDLNK